MAAGAGGPSGAVVCDGADAVTGVDGAGAGVIAAIEAPDYEIDRAKRMRAKPECWFETGHGSVH